MGKIRDTYEAQKRKNKQRADARTRALKALLAHVDKVIDGAIAEGSGYHAGEVQDLNDARHSVGTVLAHASRRVAR